MFKRTASLSVLMLLAVLFAASSALAAPNVAPSPAALQYGEVDLHYGGSPQQTVTISQIALGEPPTVVESVSVVGAEASSFQVTSDGCSGAELENGKSCSVEVAFLPGSQPGAHAAALELLTSEGPIEVPLSASAITGTLSASPVSFSPIPFTAPGSHNEGENNETEPLNIQNSANASTRVQSASVTGPDAASFSIQWDCNGTVIGTSNSCGMGIRFQPTSPGPKNATLEVLSDSAAGPLSVPLSGVGLHGPHMSVNTSQAMLGPVVLGSSVEQTFDVSNSGDYPLFIQRTFLVTGTPLMFPIGEDTCTGAILYPGEACAVHVSFTPTALGEKSGALLFITNTPAINVVGIDGIGVGDEPAVAVLPPTPHTHAPAPAPTGATTASVLGSPPAPAGADRTPTPVPSLSALGLPRLLHLAGRTTLDPGAELRCPAASSSCQSLTYILAGDGVRSPANGHRRTHALLGSAIGQLRAGASAPVRIPLNRRAIARLRRNGHLNVRVGVIVQSGGQIVAEHMWTMQLSSSGAAWRKG